MDLFKGYKPSLIPHSFHTLLNIYFLFLGTDGTLSEIFNLIFFLVNCNLLMYAWIFIVLIFFYYF